MQGGGTPNNANGYGSYQAGAVGGYPPQQQPQQAQQQPQQAQQQPQHQQSYQQYQQLQYQQQQQQQYTAPQQGSYAPRGGYAQGYYPQQQQAYGGYQGQAYAQQAYAAQTSAYSQQQGAYSQQQGTYSQQQGTYSPRGGYSQGSYPTQQQMQQGAYSPRGGYAQGQGYYPQQQGYQQGSPYSPMQPVGFQGGQNRGMGLRGGFAGRGSFNRGRGSGARGGRGGGRGVFLAPETAVMVHVDSYAKLEEAGRKGTTEEVLPEELLTRIRARARGTPIRLLVVVEKKYVAACLSLPRQSDDVLLSQKTAETFLQVGCATVFNGARLVEVANGADLQSSTYGYYRHLVAPMTMFDKVPPKPEEGETQPDVHTQPTEELLDAIKKSVTTYEAILTAMSADSDESTQLFARLMRLDTEGSAGDAAVAHGEDREEHGEDEAEGGEENGGQTEESNEVEKSANSTSATAAAGKVRESLLSTAQGIHIIHTALTISTKRQLFFEKLTPAPVPADADPNASLQWSTSLRLLAPLMQHPLLSDLLYDFVGVVPVGVTDAKPSKPKAAELKALCDAVARYGLFLCSSWNSAKTLMALFWALDGDRDKAVAASDNAASEVKSRPGVKRGRAEETKTTSATESEEPVQKTKTEGEAEGESTETKKDETKADSYAPATMADYKAPSPPSDWHLYYAIAESFCTGELPNEFRRRHNVRGPREAPAEAEKTPVTLESRLRFVAHFTTTAYLVRYLVPVFADAVLASLKSTAGRKKKEHEAFVRNCETILSTFAGTWMTAPLVMTDGYFYRHLVAALAPRAIAGTPVETALRTLYDRILSTVFEASREKFCSHSVQEALLASRQTKEGGQFVIQVAQALMEKGDAALLTLAISPAGNYVVRQLCALLTQYATGMVAVAEQAVVEEAAELEVKYFAFMTSNLRAITTTACGRGLVAWRTEQEARLSSAAKPTEPASVSDSAAAPSA